MESLWNWLSSLQLSGVQIIAIVIFFLYILISGVGFAVVYVAGQGYTDLAKGLRRILERQEQEGTLSNIDLLAEEINRYYDSYAKYNPAVSQRYPCIINWMDDIILQTNLFSKKKKKYGTWFDEYYHVLTRVQHHLETKNPFYRCSSSQAQILEDIRTLAEKSNSTGGNELLKKTEEEFIRLSGEGRKNERINYISVAIGVAGILVSVLLTVLQMFG